MYEYDGLTYTEKQLKDYAAKNNIDFDTYMSNMRQIGMTSKDDGNNPVGRWKSFKNTLYNNFIERPGDIPEYYKGDEGAGSALDIGSTLVYEYIFGKEKMKDWQKTSMGKWFFDGYVGTDDKEFQNTLKKFEEEQKQTRRTMTFKEADDPLDYLTVVASAIIDVGGSVGYTLGTLGTGFFMDFAADNFITANEAKAASKNIDINELLRRGEADIEAPTKIAAFQAGLEYVGFSKIMRPLKGTAVGKAYNKQIGKFLTKNYSKNKNIRIGLDIVSTGTTEAFTEMGQTGLEIYNKELAEAKGEGKEINAYKSIFKGMFSDEGIEAGLQGFFGGGGLKGGTYSARALSNIRKSNKDLDVENDINKLSEILKKQNQTQDVDLKIGFEEEIRLLKKSIRNKIKKGNDIYNSLSDDDISSIESLSDLNSTIAFKINSLVEKVQQNKISRQDFAIASEGLIKRYKENKAKIQEISYSKDLKFAQEEGAKIGKKVVEVDSLEEFQKIYNQKRSEADFDGDVAGRDGFIKGNEIFINKQTALKTGAISVGSHELFHGILGDKFSSLKTEDKIKLGKGFIGFLNSEQEAAVRKRMKDSYGLEGDSIFESEEIFTAFSDAIQKNEITFNDTIFQKVALAIQNVLKKLGINKEFSNGRQAYDFLKEYSKNVKEGKLSERVTSFADQTDIDTQAKASISQIYQQVESMKPDLTSDNLNQRENAAFLTANMLENEVDRRMPKIEGMSLEERADIIRDFLFSKGRGLLGILTRYDQSKNDSIMGYLNGFVPGTKMSLLDARLQEFYKNDPRFGNIIQSIQDETVGRRLERQTSEQTAEDTVDRQKTKKKIVLANRLGVTKEVSKAIYKIFPDLDIDKLTFKTLKNKVPNIVGELFGINPLKLTPDLGLDKDGNVIENKKFLANLSGKELQAAQMFINKNADLLIAMLPEGATASGTATGVPSSLLKEFYTKKERAKAKKTGSTAGLPIQEKNKKIDKNKFLEVFGIIDGKPDRTNRNTSAKVLALANTLGKMITNQAVRQRLGEATTENNEQLRKLKDGKSTILFSNTVKNVEESTRKPETNSKTLYTLKPGVISKDIHGIDLTPSKTEKRRKKSTGEIEEYSTRDLEAPFKINGKETGETYGQAGARVINTFLESFPEFRRLIRVTLTGRNTTFYHTKGKFNDSINDAKVDQDFLSRRKYSVTGSLYDRVFHRNFINGEFDSENNGRLPLLLRFFKAVEAHLQNYPEDVWMFEEMLLDSSKHMGGSIRILAPFTFYPVDKNGNPIFNEKIAEEHTDPQNLVGKALLAAAVFNNVDTVWKFVGKSYMQGAILKVDDTQINNSGYQRSMPDIYYEKIVPRLINGKLNLPDGYASVIRLIESGLDMNKYKFAFGKGKGKTIAEFFGVKEYSDNINLQNDLIRKQLTGEAAIRFSISEKNQKLSQAAENARKTKEYHEKSRGMSAFDFDETLIIEGKNFIVAKKGNQTVKISSAEWPIVGQQYEDAGFTFDFSDFVNVRGGVDGPLLQKMRNQIKKFGPSNVFVLTARPPESAKAIHGWLKSKGISIPLKNITGLGNSTGEAKALWMAGKFAEGYNDMYFVDDALPNVKAVKDILDQLDVKSNVQQAKIKFSQTINEDFNDILEDVSGIKSETRYSNARANKAGEDKGGFRFFVPPSHEDFAGLLYNFMGKGRLGNKHREFFERTLLKPLARGYRELNIAKQAIANNYRTLLKKAPLTRKKLRTKIPGSDYYYSDAVRVYLWNKAGFEIPGISQAEIKELVDIVEASVNLTNFARVVGVISKQAQGYVEPSENWQVGDIRTDLQDATGRVGRKRFFAEYLENSKIIFSKENLNKIEAAYGADFRNALEDMLYRIEKGSNRPTGQNKNVNLFLDYINGSIGATMFFNARSAVLQTISTVNFINFADNNIFKAAEAFSNQEQFWVDFKTLFNSDMLKQRRAGVAFDLNASEIAGAVSKAKTSTGKARAAIKYLLQIGFLPTQLADSFAIAFGGATMYRNRINTYKQQGFTQKEAETKAFEDFQEISESTQQSARPDKISQQQASVLGRLILAFQNTPSQYVRLMKKAGSDLINRRISKGYTDQARSDMSNISKIIYYGAVQNVIFYSLQSALFAMLFGEDEEDEEKTEKFFKTKKQRVINGSIDTVLRGAGIAGAVISTIKNTAIKYAENQKKDWGKEDNIIMMELLQLSPPIGIKARKYRSYEKTMDYNKKVIDEMDTFDVNNPIWDAYSQIIEAATNVPLARLYRKVDNLRAAVDTENAWWQRLATGLGWSRWDVGVKDKEVDEVRDYIKKSNKSRNKKKSKLIIID